jgi:hypothetical protein
MQLSNRLFVLEWAPSTDSAVTRLVLRRVECYSTITRYEMTNNLETDLLLVAYCSFVPINIAGSFVPFSIYRLQIRFQKTSFCIARAFAHNPG